MRRIASVCLALLTTLLIMPAGTQAQGDAPDVRVTQVDSSAYPELTLHVSVEERGQPRPGLLQGDFSVTEDGVPVELTGFGGSGSTPISALLATDCSGSMKYEDKIDGARAAARTFVEMMRPGDQTALLTFCGETDLAQPFTGDTAQLQQAIGRLDADGPTPLYDGLMAGVEALEGQAGRRALLLLSDGRDCYQQPCSLNPGSNASLDEAIAAARSAGVAVQVIGLGEPSASANDNLGLDEAVLRRIADETGGAYFHTPDATDLATLYAQLGGSLQREYTLTYLSPRPYYDGTRRDIRVEVGSAVSQGAYTEQHLIDVRSDPLVGLLLLLPLLLALLLPTLRRGSWRRQPRPAQAGLVAAAAAPAPAAAIPAAMPMPVNSERRCVRCNSVLRPTARFCGTCGTTQPTEVAAAAAPQRVFCDQCGRPILPGARFCDQCGATAPVVGIRGSRGGLPS